jgi:hypothetical protein
MKIVLREKQNLVTEASKANPIDVLTKVAIKSIVNQLVLNPPFDERGVVEIYGFRKELERLKSASSKYDNFKIEHLYLDYYGVSGLTSEYGAKGIYASDKDIYVFFKPPYTENELEMYKEFKKGKGQSKEKFEKDLEAAKNSKDSFINRTMQPPEYAISKTANKENLRMYSKRLQMRPYYTEESVISGIEGRKAKGRIYNWLMSKYNLLSSAFSIIAHELRHSYQTGHQKFHKQLHSYDPRGLRQLELDSKFYQMNDYAKEKFDVPKTGQVMTSYYYYTSPIEIDSRLTQYRKAKKQDPEKSYFDIIMKDEKSRVDSLNAVPNYSFRFTEQIATKEMKSKALYLILNQIKKQDNKIFNSDPRFEEELQKAFAEVKEVLSDPRFIKAKNF